MARFGLFHQNQTELDCPLRTNLLHVYCTGRLQTRPARHGALLSRVDEERTFDGVTIPTRLIGGWDYGTDRFDESAASSFTVCRAERAR